MKRALCIPAPAEPMADGVHSFDLTALADYFWAERPACETDESKLQIIPYSVVINSHGQIFTYTRGGAGDENRLHAKLSIGVGGHVDTAEDIGFSLRALLQHEAAREIKEEIGATVDPNVIEFHGVIVDRTDEVGRVHIGLLTVVRVDETGEHEANVIEKGEFRTLDDLMWPDTFERLEKWSQRVVLHLAEGRASM